VSLVVLDFVWGGTCPDTKLSRIVRRWTVKGTIDLSSHVKGRGRRRWWITTVVALTELAVSVRIIRGILTFVAYGPSLTGVA
jgi:hypothetical protein